jgi:hypothetical protein
MRAPLSPVNGLHPVNDVRSACNVQVTLAFRTSGGTGVCPGGQLAWGYV